MKKVGLLTFHFVNNNGAILQCIALYTILNSFEDVETIVIDYQPDYHTNMYQPIINPFSQAKALIKSFSGRSVFYKIYRYFRNVVSSLLKSVFFIERYKRRRLFSEYYKKNMNLSVLCHNASELYRECGNYDVYIVGSDQLWNSSITNYTIDYSYYLKFLKDYKCKRITYAVSASFKRGEINQALPYLRRFDHISLREGRACEQLSGVLDKDRLRIDLDPAFLLTASEYQCFEEEISIEGEYVVFYGLPSEDKRILLQTLKKVCEFCPLRIVDISPIKHLFPIKVERIKYYTPGQFLTIMKHASFILTNSYHGIVFSIIYNKAFYAVQPSLHSERITYLLDDLNLSDRIISDQELVGKEIDWIKVNERINSKRVSALKYLKSAIEE